jgi:hypothetical protein
MERQQQIIAAAEMARQHFDTPEGQERFLNQFAPDIAQEVRAVLAISAPQAQGHETEPVLQESVA